MDSTQHFTITAPDQHSISVYRWAPKAISVGSVHISHGMAEYGLRYAPLARRLNEAGLTVYAHDHRGHGKAITGDHNRGHFADHNGWSLAVDDIASVVRYIQQHHPQPLFLLGHSMGSYLLQSYLLQSYPIKRDSTPSIPNNPPHLSGVVLSGSNYIPTPLLIAARALARFEIWRQGKRGRSALINRLTFDSYNRHFKPNRTPFDWLSRDPEQVDHYINDPLCGFSCSNQLWADLFTGLQSICSIQSLRKLPADLPVLVLGGEQDPVSAPDGQQRLAAAITTAGSTQLTTDIYPQGRHEMFNDTHREQVITRLIQWIDRYLLPPSSLHQKSKP